MTAAACHRNAAAGFRLAAGFCILTSNCARKPANGTKNNAPLHGALVLHNVGPGKANVGDGRLATQQKMTRTRECGSMP